jgi:hypothetical protein
MLLIYSDPTIEPQTGTPEFGRMMEGYIALSEKLRAAGAMKGGDELQGVETATSVRIRQGRLDTMDGPFAATKEHLGGYYRIDVPDLDAALSYAAMMPPAHRGTVEVRALMDYNPAGN